MLNKLKQEVEDINSEVEDMKGDMEKLQDNLGVLPIYREIIASNRKMLNISIITIIFLSILLFINVASTIHNEKEFAKYRENSISKDELVTILNTFADSE